MLAPIFFLAGISKISGYAGSPGYMESMGVPGMLLPLVILLEIGRALARLLGWQTRRAAPGPGRHSTSSRRLFSTAILPNRRYRSCS
ncbi:DoxX family protein [Thiohalophilus sp.]|uniref:DoxX family protein n=1 Tax=Thiohalophilus sp. TaxID=3028392 RepID=UPI003975A192